MRNWYLPRRDVVQLLTILLIVIIGVAVLQLLKSRAPNPAPSYSKSVSVVEHMGFGGAKKLKPLGAARFKPGVAEVFITRFKKTAQQEQIKFGIPASITLAQGLHESGAGGSTLARESKNYFGVKCFAKGCAPGHCIPFHDDEKPGQAFYRYRVYPSAWASFRSHSKVLAGKRYKSLFTGELSSEFWTSGLQALGYATSKRYAFDLLDIIETYNLTQYDRPTR